MIGNAAQLAMYTVPDLIKHEVAETNIFQQACIHKFKTGYLLT